MSDQAARLMQSHFAVNDHELLIGGVGVRELAEEFGTPLFVYDQAIIENSISRLRECYPARFELFYSIKANPNAAILRCFLQQGCGLEIASGGELELALDAGCAAERLIFAGPGKTTAELEAAVKASIGELHLESIDEAIAVDAIAAAHRSTVNVALRVNPVGGQGGAMQMGGRSCAFGIDEEHLDEAIDRVLSLDQLHLSGVHLFMATQILDAEVLLKQYQRGLEIARYVAERIPYPLASIDFGGGLGIPYFPKERALDLARVAAGLNSLVDKMEADPLLRGARAVVEPGRFLIGEAGVYLTRVTRVKQSRGTTYAVLDGGMHHHLAASGNLGQTIKRNFPVAVANKIGIHPQQRTEVVGPLCTPLDTLARKAELPEMEAGDLFAVFQSGAYARTSSPHGFLSHASPAEVLVHRGRARLVRRRGTIADQLRDQIGPRMPPASETPACGDRLPGRSAR